MSLQLNDPKTLEAMGILANVLDDITGPERLECLMAANALRQVVDTRSEAALDFARQAFESLNGDVRRRIHSDATETAIRAVERATRRLEAPRPKHTGGILDALNNSGLRSERKW